ncbi:hypothetical protein ABPG74_007715 [Tetrahymena malaccensis]
MQGVVYQNNKSSSSSSSSSAQNSKSAAQNKNGPNQIGGAKSAQKSQQYFDQPKRGEVDELREILKKHMFDRDEKKKRDLVKKVIAYMTLGIDVSKLFDQMVIVSQTADVVQKKMIYLYLTNYAEQNPDTALMAINTFIKDCDNKDPKVKGLALRSLCSLRFSGSFEYLIPAINKALQDIDPYVRKTAIMGCVKVFYMNPEAIKNKEIIDTLYKMIKDPDALVMQNAICALNEILADEGGIKTYRQMIIHLLNNLKNFNNWGQTIVLQLVAKYTPINEEEMYDIMNLLDERLKQSCISVVLGTIKVFMNFTQNNQKIYNSVFKRVKTPLITLMSSTETTGSFEITYPVLCHISLITSKGGASFFQDDFKQFYCKADEPTYIKFMKLNIISNLANEINIGDIMNELGEYVTDVDSELAKESIRTLGKIACRIQEMATPIIKQLSNFINMKQDYITNNTLVAFQQILRKYPQVFKEIVECIPECFDFATETESKCALLWILGEFSNQIADAPYHLINFISNEQSEHIDVKQTYLVTCIKIFLRTPDEMRQTLGQAFQTFLSKDESIDLKDRAAFFYRAMQDDIEGFKQIMLNEHSNSVDKYCEEKEESEEQTNFDFNTLAVIFKKSQDKFIKPFSYFALQRNKEAADEKMEEEKQNEEATSNAPTPQAAAETPTTFKQNTADLIDMAEEQSQQAPNQISQPAGNSTPLNLLDMDDGFGAPRLSGLETNDLVLNFSVDPDDYEPAWNNLNEGATTTRLVNPGVHLTENAVEELFKKHRIYSAAQGEEDDTLKFYLYAKHQSTGNVVYMEFDLNTSSRVLSLGTRCANEEIAAFFSKFVLSFLKEKGILN